MEQQHLQAIEALEISDNSVKCQRCGNAVPIVGKLSRPCNDRVAVLQDNKMDGKLLSWCNLNDLRALKQELEESLEDPLCQIWYSHLYDSLS